LAIGRVWLKIPIVTSGSSRMSCRLFPKVMTELFQCSRPKDRGSHRGSPALHGSARIRTGYQRIQADRCRAACPFGRRPSRAGNTDRPGREHGRPAGAAFAFAPGSRRDPNTRSALGREVHAAFGSAPGRARSKDRGHHFKASRGDGVGQTSWTSANSWKLKLGLIPRKEGIPSALLPTLGSIDFTQCRVELIQPSTQSHLQTLFDSWRFPHLELIVSSGSPPAKHSPVDRSPPAR
jgi:hypothetical protein